MWTASVVGDGLGYDVQSFEPSGDIIYIEVKATAHGAETPFYISTAELEFARRNLHQCRLYRVFDVLDQPRFFLIEGDITASIEITPATYQAKFASTAPIQNATPSQPSVVNSASQIGSSCPPVWPHALAAVPLGASPIYSVPGVTPESGRSTVQYRPDRYAGLVIANTSLLDSSTPSGDPGLRDVADELISRDPAGLRVASVLRRTYDMLLDGQHTGRYRWDQLYKTEKTYFGTLVEINLQREFGFADGKTMDFAICGIDVDCKYSQDLADWMIPPEAVGHIILGLWASDDQGRWSLGLVRANDHVLTGSRGNRDLKRRLSATGKAGVSWIFRDFALPENALLRIPALDVQKIFTCSRHGTKRVDMLFRLAQQCLISRTVVATVAQQEDYMKRVRGNGGSRSSLRSEGIVIIGQYESHRRIAQALAVPIPGPGESVSVRLTRQRSCHAGLSSVVLDGSDWVVARPDDPVETAPVLPDTREAT